jgi:hypothetical protein
MAFQQMVASIIDPQQHLSTIQSASHHHHPHQWAHHPAMLLMPDVSGVPFGQEQQQQQQQQVPSGRRPVKRSRRNDDSAQEHIRRSTSGTSLAAAAAAAQQVPQLQVPPVAGIPLLTPAPQPGRSRPALKPAVPAAAGLQQQQWALAAAAAAAAAVKDQAGARDQHQGQQQQGQPQELQESLLGLLLGGAGSGSRCEAAALQPGHQQDGQAQGAEQGQPAKDGGVRADTAALVPAIAGHQPQEGLVLGWHGGSKVLDLQ